MLTIHNWTIRRSGAGMRISGEFRTPGGATVETRKITAACVVNTRDGIFAQSVDGATLAKLSPMISK